jgi:hypothetical protein
MSGKPKEAFVVDGRSAAVDPLRSFVADNQQRR